MFTKLDADHNGFLTFEELEAGMSDIAKIFHLEEDDVKEMLRAADNNGDGQVDYTEFIAAAMQKDLMLKRENLKSAFRLFDVNGDGTVTKDELKAVFGGASRGEDVWDQIMNEVDKNNDGKIAKPELFEIFKRVISGK